MLSLGITYGEHYDSARDVNYKAVLITVVPDQSETRQGIIQEAKAIEHELKGLEVLEGVLRVYRAGIEIVVVIDRSRRRMVRKSICQMHDHLRQVLREV